MIHRFGEFASMTDDYHCPSSHHETSRLPGKSPGTSGLRKKVKVFAQPNYAELYQSVFDVVNARPRDFGDRQRRRISQP
jgi:hypothetical protein